MLNSNTARTISSANTMANTAVASLKAILNFPGAIETALLCCVQVRHQSRLIRSVTDDYIA